MSNCTNSGIAKAYILTQINSASLNRQIPQTDSFSNSADIANGFVEIVKANEIDDILILSGDHLNRMDYKDFSLNFFQSDTDIRTSCLPINYSSRASDFGLMKIDNTGRVVSFSEKPKGDDDDLKSMPVDTTLLGLPIDEARKTPFLNLLRWYCFAAANDFGSEIIPQAAKRCIAKAYLFKGYWEDIGTIKSFPEANLVLLTIYELHYR